MALAYSQVAQIRPADTEPMQAACSRCACGKLCFPHAIPTFYRSLFPLASDKRTRLRRGEYLFHARDRQVALYAVKAGFLMSSMALPDGQRKIVGFHAMGDVLGLDGLGANAYRTDAIAMNDCEVCVIHLEKFEQLLEHPAESSHVRQLLAGEIARVESHAAVIGTLSAKQRVAAFLLDMSERWENCGYSKSEFVLFMSRKEIGNYLGLTFETVSRTISYFQSKKWIKAHGKTVHILNMSALQSQLANATFGLTPRH